MEIEEKLIVSKHWHKPEHEILIGQKGFAITTSVADVAKALSFEIGNPMWILTKAQLEAKMKAAFEEVLRKIKEVSVHT